MSARLPRVDPPPSLAHWCEGCGGRFEPGDETAVRSTGALRHQRCANGILNMDQIACGEWSEMAQLAGDPERLVEARARHAIGDDQLRRDAAAYGFAADEPPICPVCAHGVEAMGHGPGCPRDSATLGWRRCVEAISDAELRAAHRRGVAIGSLAELDARAEQIRAERGSHDG